MAADKAAKADQKAELKILDEADEAFVGYISVQSLDQDGIAGRTLGSHVQAPLQIVSAEGAATVVMEAHFLASNPLFFLELRNEEQFYLWGRWWVGGPKHSEANQVCSLVPIKIGNPEPDQFGFVRVFRAVVCSSDGEYICIDLLGYSIFALGDTNNIFRRSRWPVYFQRERQQFYTAAQSIVRAKSKKHLEHTHMARLVPPDV